LEILAVECIFWDGVFISVRVVELEVLDLGWEWVENRIDCLNFIEAFKRG